MATAPQTRRHCSIWRNPTHRSPNRINPSRRNAAAATGTHKRRRDVRRHAGEYRQGLDPGLNLSGARRWVVDGAGQLTVDMRWPPPTGSRWAGRGRRNWSNSRRSGSAAPGRRCRPNRDRPVERERAEDRESDTTCNAPWPRRSPAT